ncbi:hypothetical protein PPTG_08445 [Phytophthora nicotianae INRA-310]|uniref:RNase H type-1 domain-containing protein n=1 Tax=Phytophthora nicotianae (strain INRA-310) TaxID=761204 RepID=W2QKK5_PHYN3|nr:hypothetical protein PPTG_08445 [Phytophthora nicotianae INRA-310]ETN13702.1 hypothetical protein PPTG_08445 [Phytophthora nicotianae INRA-310]
MLVSDLDRGRLVNCGDSNLVVRQMSGKIECKSPSLKLPRQKAMDQLRSWPEHEFLHVKRDWNQSADSLASAALQKGEGSVIMTEANRYDLITLSHLPELLVPQSDQTVIKITAVMRSHRRHRPEVLQEVVVQRVPTDRIARAQGEEKWDEDLKMYLRGGVQDPTTTEAKTCAKIAEDFETDEAGLPFSCPPSKQSGKDGDLVMYQNCCKATFFTTTIASRCRQTPTYRHINDQIYIEGI